MHAGWMIVVGCVDVYSRMKMQEQYHQRQLTTFVRILLEEKKIATSKSNKQRSDDDDDVGRRVMKES